MDKFFIFVPLFVSTVFLAGCLPEKEGAETQVVAPVVPEVAEEPEPVLEIEPEFVPDPRVPEFTTDKTRQVSVLCYHDFGMRESSNAMVIPANKFRLQMQALEEAGITVVSMADFLAWRRGEIDLPEQSVVITIDDGWKSTHTIALPVLKEFGYPFTVFLYAKYVNGGSRALTYAEIGEIMEHGGAIGSHSVSHPGPAKVRRMEGLDTGKNDAFILHEMEGSRKFLESKFGGPVTTYAYPGGLYTDRMLELNEGVVGYEALFTCNPSKVTWDTPGNKIHRFVIHGNDDSNFHRATTFPGSGRIALDTRRLAGEGGEPSIRLTPKRRRVISDRTPLISADFSRMGPLEPGSLSMEIGGLGQVPAEYDAETGIFSYQPRRALRGKTWVVVVRFRQQEEEKHEIVSWKFVLDPIPHYLEDGGVDDVVSKVDSPASSL